MPEIKINLDQAKDLTKMLLAQSISAKAREIFGFSVDLEIEETQSTIEPIYTVIITLPNNKYFYAVDLEKLSGYAVKFVGMKASFDGKLLLYFEIKLNKFLLAIQQSEMLRLQPSANEPQKEQKTEGTQKDKNNKKLFDF